MTEAEKEEIRNKLKPNAERLEKAFAPEYLGKQCPARNMECLGPGCMWFLRQVEGDKIVGGNCSVNVLAQAISGGLVPAAFAMLQQQSNTAPGQIQRLVVPGQG